MKILQNRRNIQNIRLLLIKMKKLLQLMIPICE